MSKFIDPFFVEPPGETVIVPPKDTVRYVDTASTLPAAAAPVCPSIEPWTGPVGFIQGTDLLFYDSQVPDWT